MGPRSLINQADPDKTDIHGTRRSPWHHARQCHCGHMSHLLHVDLIDRVLRGEPDARHQLRIIWSPRHSLGLFGQWAIPASLSSGCAPPPFYATPGFQWQTVVEKTSIGALSPDGTGLPGRCHRPGSGPPGHPGAARRHAAGSRTGGRAGRRAISTRFRRGYGGVGL